MIRDLIQRLRPRWPRNRYGTRRFVGIQLRIVVDITAWRFDAKLGFWPWRLRIGPVWIWAEPQYERGFRP